MGHTTAAAADILGVLHQLLHSFHIKTHRWAADHAHPVLRYVSAVAAARALTAAFAWHGSDITVPSISLERYVP